MLWRSFAVLCLLTPGALSLTRARTEAGVPDGAWLRGEARVRGGQGTAPDAQPAALPPRLRTADAPDLERPAVDLSRKAQTGPRAGEPVTTRYAVTFKNLHTRELLPLPEGTDEGTLVSERGAIERFLRCRATHQARPMALRPMAVALTLAERFDARRIDVVSGYRSVKFNEMLRKKGHEVATRSHHTRGQALDFALPDVGARRLAAAAAAIHEGGIGTYTESGFIHVDVGRDRRWRGR
jgi:uncharacterized protein YcbK (DUF882 family)